MADKEADIIFDKATKAYDNSRLVKRARKKYFSLGLVMGLVKLESPLYKQYWDTWHCAEVLKVQGEKITGKYCKHRWCLVCNAIRTAQNIMSYSEIIEGWGKEAYFGTLTIVSVEAEELKISIDSMLKNFTNIVRLIKTRRNMEFIGIRKLECTYNPIKNTYHPHFHYIVKGKPQAELLKNEWLKRYPSAEPYCQDIRQAQPGTSKELFKYFTKIITNSKDTINKAPIEYRRKIYLSALDTIFQAVEGRRTFQNYGFKKKILPDNDQEVITLSEKLYIDESFNWIAELHDWIGQETGICLSGYEPSEAMKNIVEGINEPKNNTS